jgi:hypothetical protein
VAKVADREEEERAEEEALTAAATKSAAMKAVGILADLDYSEPQVRAVTPVSRNVRFCYYAIYPWQCFMHARNLS